MTTPEAEGQRFICAAANHSIRDIALVLDEKFSDRGFRIPTGKLPNFVMHIVALFDKTARLGLNDLGVHQNIDNSRIKSVLNWQPRDLEEMVEAMGNSFIEYGIVSP